ncbi:MAG: MFS transporter [Chloroflexi bacterium]|nr:MFS transporter [Chloroflexota bacterium]
MISNTTGSESRRQSRVFYGWWIVAVSSILGMFGNGAISSGFPRFFEPIRQDLGISSTQMGLVFGLARAEGGMGGPLVGWLVDKYGARPMVFFGGLIAGIGLMLLSRAHSYWELVFLFAGVVSLGKTAALGQTLMAVVNQWFIRRKALALSTLMTAFAGGGAFVVLLLDLGISHLGWRNTVFFTGLFIALLTLPVSLVMRSRPEDMGLRPDGDPPLTQLVRPAAASGDAGSGEEGKLQLEEGDFTVRQALRTSSFWLLLAGVITRVSATNAIIVHIYPILELKGLDANAATFYISAMFFMAIPLRFVLGVAGGRFAPRKLLFWGMNLGAVGIFALWAVPGTAGVVVFVLGLAVVEGITSVNWLMVGDYFGRSRFASLMGAMSVFHNIGLFIAPVFAGWVRDTTGSYAIVLLTFAPMFVVSAFFFALARRPSLPIGAAQLQLSPDQSPESTTEIPPPVSGETSSD